MNDWQVIRLKSLKGSGQEGGGEQPNNTTCKTDPAAPQNGPFKLDFYPKIIGNEDTAQANLLCYLRKSSASNPSAIKVDFESLAGIGYTKIDGIDENGTVLASATGELGIDDLYRYDISPIDGATVHSFILEAEVPPYYPDPAMGATLIANRMYQERAGDVDKCSFGSNGIEFSAVGISANWIHFEWKIIPNQTLPPGSLRVTVEILSATWANATQISLAADYQGVTAPSLTSGGVSGGHVSQPGEYVMTSGFVTLLQETGGYFALRLGWGFDWTMVGIIKKLEWITSSGTYGLWGSLETPDSVDGQAEIKNAWIWNICAP